VTAEDLLVDQRTGVVTSLTRQPMAPGMPLAWVAYGATVARAFTADRFGFGAALGDPDRARRAALGEAIERYCGNAVPVGLPLLTFDELRSDAVDPESLALYSPRQYASVGFPFVPFTRDLPVSWVTGRDLRTHAPVQVPLSLAYLDTNRPELRQPPTNALCYAGIATGETREQAERFALQELLERDASTLWWASDEPALLVEDGQEIVDLLDDPFADQRTVRLLQVPSEFGVPVLGAFVEDHAERLVAFGTACRSDPREAAVKALVEAFGLLQVTKQLADPDGDIWRAVHTGEVGPHTFKPFRPERDYAEAFRADYRDLIDLPAVAQLYLDPRMQGEALDRLRPTKTVRLAEIPAGEGDLDLPTISVDLTTPDVRKAGLTVVRVIVPGLYGNAPAAFPYLGGTRLSDDGVVRPPIPLA
jgi:ribosomal protein S12 methylthiotransferase accessory factor